MRGRLCIPRTMQRRILHEAHNTPAGGHFGANWTYFRMKDQYFWKQMWLDTQRYVAGCDLCHWTNHQSGKPMGLLQPLPIAKSSWQRLRIDFMTDLPMTGKWPRLHCNVCRPHDQESTLAILHDNNRCSCPRAHLHLGHHLPRQSASRGCIGPQCALPSRLLERSGQDSADKAAHVYGVPSKNGWSLWKLRQEGCTWFAWLRNSRLSPMGRLPAISAVCLQIFSTPFDEADACWTWSWLWASFAARLNCTPPTTVGQWISENVTRPWICQTIAAHLGSCQGWAVQWSGYTDSWG